MNPGRVIVFARAPRPGQVKTRLAADLDGPAAAAIAVVLIERTVSVLRGFERVEMRITPDDALGEFEGWRRPGWPQAMVPQGGGDLGVRMRRAFEEAFAAGEARVVAVGTDCPALANSDLREAFEALSTEDVVLGPAEDGGYWLIGMRGPAAVVFEDIPWSTDRVLEVTLERAAGAGLSVRTLRRLQDVDTLQDWRRWLRDEPL